MPDYDTVLEIVAENPGVDTEEFREIIAELTSDPEPAVEFLEAAVAREDVLRIDGKHWIVRKGKYSYANYDHPDP